MSFMILFTAKYLIYIIILISFIYWLTLPKKQKIDFIVFGFIVAIVSLILVKIGGILYYDPRPFVSHGVSPIYPHAPNNGFPSDHTALSMVMAATVFRFSKKVGLTLIFLAVCVGVARVAGNIHSPIDIIGSVIIVVAGYWTAKLIIKLFNKYYLKNKVHKTSEVS